MGRSDNSIWRYVRPAVQPPLQFTLTDLLILQAVCAAILGLFSMVGLYALPAIFLATLALAAIPVPPRRERLKRYVIDVLGGMILPAICLLCLYLPTDVAETADLFVFVGSQMLALFVWLALGARSDWWNGLFAGILLVGAIASGFVATMAFFAALLFMMQFGIGLLGFVPILTCYVFLGNAADARRRAHDSLNPGTVRLLIVSGIVIAVAVPVLIHVLIGRELGEAVKMAPWPLKWSLQSLAKG